MRSIDVHPWLSMATRSTLVAATRRRVFQRRFQTRAIDLWSTAYTRTRRSESVARPG